jgi:hypothetical protein
MNKFAEKIKIIFSFFKKSVLTVSYVSNRLGLRELKFAFVGV